MKFSVGYQLRNDAVLTDAIIESSKSIDEIYFSWENFANGRSRGFSLSQMSEQESREKRDADFELLFKNGLKFNLLLNGNCYGKDALSREFFYKVGDAFKDFENRIDIIAGEAKVNPETAKKILDNIFFYPPAQHAYQCSICGRACDTECYAHLEEKGVLNKKFNRPFRTREPWEFSIEDFK
ncbi:MAG: hypothetical protein E7526_00795 [Ruminococcaceae bacterium]|nr:hypothetical protein [Oscillospiraceae bacterium]